MLTPDISIAELAVKNKLALPYAILAGIFLVTIPFTPYPGSFVPKVLPIVMLLVLTLMSKPFRGKAVLSAAILFSGCGDVVLDLSFQGSFIAGLASFLVAHVCYITVFALNFRMQRKMLVVTVLGLVFPAAMAIFLWPLLGAIQIPVAVYVAAIATMFILSLHRATVNTWIICGAAFFVVSDSVLALNRFYAPIPAARYAIMVTYYFAQFLIVVGLIDETTEVPSV